MDSANLILPIAAIFTAQVVRWILWGGLVALTIGALVVIRTSWGQSQPLRKCMALSLLAHLLIGIYATTVTIMHAGTGGGGSPAPISISILNGPAEDEPNGVGEERPWNSFATGPASNQMFVESASPPMLAPEETAEPERDAASAPSLVPSAITSNSLPRMAETEPEAPAITADPTPIPKAVSKSAEPIEAPIAENPATPSKTEPADLVPPPEVARTGDDENGGDPTTMRRTTPSSLPSGIVSGAIERKADGADGLSAASTSVAPDLSKPAAPAAGLDETGAGKVPTIYQERFAPNRARIAEGHGGSRDTEAAVAAALKWLAAHQSPDGRWHASNFDAGREVMVNGHDRRGAGSHADTGITGLVLLAFLAGGNTHLEGEYATTVRRGLEFLLRSQAADGSIFGDATIYEKMYCHAMATFALSEDFAMTHDERMKQGVQNAVSYCIAAQDRMSGGWRYQPGDPGDTSQLGWQVMALKSAELAGIRVPDETKAGMIRFLKSVASGRSGGLASYRPGHVVSRAMTAEALVCRQFLGMTRDNPAGLEAGDYLMQELPGRGQPNVYYWYYGTLGMYQIQGERWQLWNKALQESLLKTQQPDGDFAGSWNPDAAWGAYGGRAYSTALSALCLEVYYRFLPLYVEAASRENPAK